MSEPGSKQAAGAKGGLLTLSEVSKRTKISMPTLQRYKKEYQSRIPSVGQGRKQRYPEESLDVFQEIKKENVGRRGRPRKNAALPRRRRQAARSEAQGRQGGRPRAQAGGGGARLDAVAPRKRQRRPAVACSP